MVATRVASVLSLSMLALAGFVPSASAATTFTQNAFRATVNGQGVVLVANLGARPSTKVNNAGFCTRDAAGALVNQVAPAMRIPSTGVTIRQTIATLPSGAYTSVPCVRLGSTGSYTDVGSRKSFTIAQGSTPPPTCSGTTIRPGTDVPGAVAAAPGGTTFCFAPGSYTLNDRIAVKSGDVFDGGNRAAVLDGGNRTQFAFQGAGTDAVIIRGLTIQHFATPLQEGAVDGFSTTNWVIDNNHITQNAASGIATETGVKVTDNLIDHNKQEGYAAHGHDILYQNNEIAYNNEDLSVDATWEAGGGKTWDTQHATFRNNRVHHNGGNGMWDDTNNIYITYAHNDVHDNWGAGLYHAIAYDASITGNKVSNNGTATSQGGGQKLGWMWDAGILLRSSQGLSSSAPIVIADNTVSNNYNGITLLESPASGCTNSGLNEGRYGACKIANVSVRDNTVSMSQGASGGAQDGSGTAMFTSRNVAWTGNDYHVTNVSSKPDDGYTYGWLSWNDSWPAFASWQGDGLDRAGTFGN